MKKTHSIIYGLFTIFVWLIFIIGMVAKDATMVSASIGILIILRLEDKR